MKLYVPSIGDAIILTKDWEFTLHDEYRNKSLWDTLFPGVWGNNWYSSGKGPKQTVLPAGTVLTVDRIYIKKGLREYNSLTFMVKKAPFVKKGKVRFWAKLGDVNNIEFDVYQP